jgi:multicomponent K+:H+ antiporter subunit A
MAIALTLLTLVALPFLAALAIALLHRAGRAVHSGIAAGASAGGLALLAMLTAPVLGGEVPSASWAWVPALGLDLTLMIDPLGLMFAGLILGIGLLVVIFGHFYLYAGEATGRFFASLMLFQGAMLGIVIAGNVLLLLVFWEMTSLASFLLIGFWQHKAEARQGARMALAVTGGGGLALIGGMVLLGLVAGSFDLATILERGDIVRASPLYPVLLGLILLGCFTKSAQFPFHFWLPHAMAAPTPVSAYLHSATMVKAGVFLLARLWPVLGGDRALHRYRHERGPDHDDRGRSGGAVPARSEEHSCLFHHLAARDAGDAARLFAGGSGAGGGVAHSQPRSLQGGTVHERRNRRA